MMRQRTFLLLIMPLLAIACQRAPTERRDDLPVAASPSATTPVPVSPRDAPIGAPPAQTPPKESRAAMEPATPVNLAVDDDGLRLVDAKTGKTLPLSFGLPRAVVLEPLEKTRGPAEQGSSAECGSQYAHWADGLRLTFRNEKFVGWSLDGRSDGAITTMAGLGTGSGKKVLDAYDYKVVRTTLGNEFSAGSLHGLLSSNKPDANVTTLWAGEVCLAR